MGVLVLAERDALGAHAVVLGGEQQQPAPAGADVEEAVALLEHELGADVLELRGLRLGDRHRRIAKVGARVDPSRIEPQRVEIVGDVVVELDLLGVGLRAMAQARARHQRCLAHPGERRRHGRARPGRITRHELRGGRHQLAHAAVEVDLALDVVLADLAHLAGDQVGKRRQVVEAQGHRGILAADAPAARKDDGKGKTQGPEPLLEHAGDRGHGGRSR